MYVKRDILEKQLKDCLNGHKHFIIHGESGNGKTWLWKRVFERNKITYTTINLARANALGTIGLTISEKVAREVPEEVTEVRHEGGAQFKPAGMGVDSKKTKTIKLRKSDDFSELLAKFRGIKSKHSILVFENFEQIAASEQLIKEMASYLILLDDEDYAKYFVRICIVGVPGNLKEFFSKLPFSETISTRLYEVDEVARMSPDEAEELLLRGLNMLRQRFDTEETKRQALKRILWVSDRNAEQLQELGLALAIAAKENANSIDSQLLQEAIFVWIQSKHAAACSAIEARMSPANTLYGRRNQILYSIGLIESDEFGIVDVKRVLRKNFNGHADWIDDQFDDIFATLLEGFSPLLRAEMQPGSFRLSKAIFRMAIRSLLKLDADGSVYKVGKPI